MRCLVLSFPFFYSPLFFSLLPFYSLLLSSSLYLALLLPFSLCYLKKRTGLSFISLWPLSLSTTTMTFCLSLSLSPSLLSLTSSGFFLKALTWPLVGNWGASCFDHLVLNSTTQDGCFGHWHSEGIALSVSISRRRAWHSQQRA